MHDLTLHGSHNTISFYTWDDSECCLPIGSTKATLLSTPPLFLAEGDLLLFEEIISPTTGTKGDADPTHRHAVRLTKVVKSTDPLNGTDVIDIEWYEEDALPFPLCLSARVSQGGGLPKIAEVSIARGNVVLADHGMRVHNVPLIPAITPDDLPYRPSIPDTGLCFRETFVYPFMREKPAKFAIHQNPRNALADLRLHDQQETWIPRRDLLGSDRFAPDFVVEVEEDGTARIRFGDDVLGKSPTAGSEFKATYRNGNGQAGNVGAGALRRILWNRTEISEIRNPLPAQGGTDPEAMEHAKLFAPQAFRTQRRAVTESDYAEMAQQHPQVQKAKARFRWTGSWYTVFLTIDRKGGRSVTDDPAFTDEILSHLEEFRIAGYDLEINDPVFVPLFIQLRICVKPNYFQSEVKETLFKVFSRNLLETGQLGFFHPDNFTFGQPVYLSQIFQQAMNVEGVDSVEVMYFQRWGKTPQDEIQHGVLTPAPLEILRLDQDPNFPENGKIDFLMVGGL